MSYEPTFPAPTRPNNIVNEISLLGGWLCRRRLAQNKDIYKSHKSNQGYTYTLYAELDVAELNSQFNIVPISLRKDSYIRALPTSSPFKPW